MPTYLVYKAETGIPSPPFDSREPDWEDYPPARANWQIDVRCDKVPSNGLGASWQNPLHCHPGP